MEEGLLPSILTARFSLTSTPFLERFWVGLAVGGLATVSSLRSLLHLGAASLLCIYIGCCFTSLHLRYTACITYKETGHQKGKTHIGGGWERSWVSFRKKLSSCWMSCLVLLHKNKEECGPLLDLEDAEETIYNNPTQSFSEATISDSEEVDIDTIVREYQISTISRPNTLSKSILAHPSKKTGFIVILATFLLVSCFSIQLVLLSHYSHSLPIWTCTITICSLSTVLLVFLISQQPTTILARETGKAGKPWKQCLSLGCLISLLYPLSLSIPAVVVWLMLGLLVYKFYGVSHSTLCKPGHSLPCPAGLQTLTLTNLPRGNNEGTETS